MKTIEELDANVDRATQNLEQKLSQWRTEPNGFIKILTVYGREYVALMTEKNKTIQARKVLLDKQEKARALEAKRAVLRQLRDQQQQIQV